MSQQYDHLLKFVIVGDAGVGKTSLMTRFADDTFNDGFLATIGTELKIKTIDLNGQTVKLQIWDTAGQERFRTITSSYYRGARGIFVVFDVTNRNSFENVMRWMAEIERSAPQKPRIHIVGNKIDLEARRVVSRDEARLFAESAGIELLEASAKTGDNVGQVFEGLASDILSSATPLILTLLSASAGTSSASLVCCTLTGENLEVEVPPRATTAAAAARICEVRGISAVTLLTPEGVVLSPSGVLPGLEAPETRRGCVTQ